MKKILLIIQFVICTLICNAQTPNWIWGESETTGSCNMDTHGIWAGPSGNVYIGGRFGGTMTLNGASATASGTEVFSAKMDSAGKFRWIAPHPYTNENDYDYGFGGDTHENTYVTGQTQGSNGLFVDKYDSSGNKVWSFAPGSLSSGMGGYGNIAVDNISNVYATGSFGQSENFGPVTLNPVGTNDFFLTKLDSNGNCKWAVQAGGSGANVGGRGVAIAPDGSVYVCGSYNSTTSFGSITLPTVNTDCFFIAKYDTAGNVLWVQTASNAGFQSGAFYWQFNSIAVDSCSNVYVTGHFVNTAQFGSFTLTNANSNYDIFVAKCLSNGKWEWAQSAGGPNNDEGFGITLDKYSDVYVTGYFSGSANFGSIALTTSAPNVVFVAKYSNSNGALQWVSQGGGTLGNDGIGITLDKQGYAYIVGDLSSGSGAIFGSSTISGVGGCNIFVAKLDTVAQRTITPVVLPNYCPGSTDTIHFKTSGLFNSGNVFTVQLSDSTGSFSTYTNLGTDTSTTGGYIIITIPDTTPKGSNYLFRVVSSNPATSSWANGCGAYYVNNVYINDFYVTIGGSINVALSPVSPVICSGSSIQLSASGGTSYNWSNGATTDTTTVSPSKDSTYSVIVNNGGCVLDTSITVKVNPAGVLTVLPPSQSVCSGQSVTLYVTNKDTSYAWSPSEGLNKTTGDSVIASPTVNTTYTVTAISGGCKSTGFDTIGVVPAPNKPAITVSVTGDSLISSASSYNQWFFNGQPITDSTRQILIIKGHKHGWYTVVVTNPANGCTTTSDSTTSLNQLSALGSQLSIYPNPFNNNIFIKINSSASNIDEWSLLVTDVLGRTLFTQSSLDYNNTIDLSNLPGGVYFITVINKTARVVFPVVKQN